MIRVARIGNYPTSIYNKVGYHGYQLGYTENLNTFYISPKLEGDFLELPINSSLKSFTFFLEAYPKKGSFPKKIFFLLRRILSILTFSIKSVVYLSRKKIDVVHIHSPMFCLIGLWGKLAGKQVFITFHGQDFHKIENSKLYEFFGFIFNGVFAISPTMIERLTEIHKEIEVILVGNGTEEIFENLHLDREKQIIFVGSFKPVKGHQLMIDGFAKFVQKNKDYQLLFVGSGALESELKTYVKEKQLSNFIQFLGQKSTSELVQLYNKAEIFALNSFSEGFPKVILEALACGCKVISTKVGSVPDILGHNYPFFIEEHTAVSVFNTLEKIVQTEDRIFEEYKNIPLQHSWENIRSIYLNQYQT